MNGNNKTAEWDGETERRSNDRTAVAIERLAGELKSNTTMTKEMHDVIYKNGLFVKVERNTMFRKAICWITGILFGGSIATTVFLLAIDKL